MKRRYWLLVALATPFVIAFSFYAFLKFFLGFDTPGQTEDSRQTVRAAVEAVDLPAGVTITDVDYSNDVTDPPTAVVELDVPVDVDLPAVSETVFRAVWLSEVDPLNVIRIDVRDYTEAEAAAVAADLDALPDYRDTYSIRLSFFPDAQPRPGDDEPNTYVVLTDRWGERPVDP